MLYGASPEFCPSEQSFSLGQDCSYKRGEDVAYISIIDLMERGPATIDLTTQFPYLQTYVESFCLDLMISSKLTFDP